VDLLSLHQLDENAVVILLGDAIRAAASSFDESFKVSVQKLIYFAVIVIIMTDTWMGNKQNVSKWEKSSCREAQLTVKTLDVIPDGTAKL
jgi:hypothetical protein